MTSRVVTRNSSSTVESVGTNSTSILKLSGGGPRQTHLISSVWPGQACVSCVGCARKIEGLLHWRSSNGRGWSHLVLVVLRHHLINSSGQKSRASPVQASLLLSSTAERWNAMHSWLFFSAWTSFGGRLRDLVGASITSYF